MLYLLLGDAPPACRILIIAVVFVGVVTELGAIGSVLVWLLCGVLG